MERCVAVSFRGPGALLLAAGALELGAAAADALTMAHGFSLRATLGPWVKIDNGAGKMGAI